MAAILKECDRERPATTLPKSAGEHKDVVQAELTGPVGQAIHHQLHDPQKSTRSTTKAKAKHPETPLPSPSDKGSPVTVPLVNLPSPQRRLQELKN